MRARHILVPLLALAVLGGCRLIDQRTFESAPKAPTGAQLSHNDLPPLPLLTIDPGNPDVDWRPALGEAVVAAQARKPNATFDVVTPIPTSASEQVQDLYIRNGQADAKRVADQLQVDGIDPDHISIRFQGDPGAPAREVRLYAH